MTRLLIVENSAPMRRLIRSMVAAIASPIYECDDGGQAFHVYAAVQPDWVLMDVELPGRDGISATREIKRAFPQARVIIVTEYQSTRLRQAAQLAGASAYILKENLREVLDELKR